MADRKRKRTSGTGSGRRSVKAKSRRRKKQNRGRMVFCIAVELIVVLILVLVVGWNYGMGTQLFDWLEQMRKPVVKELDISGINSPYAVLMQVRGGRVIGEINGEEQMYPASMTKIMTTIVAIENLKDLDQEITLTNEMFEGLYEQDATQAGFQPGETVPCRKGTAQDRPEENQRHRYRAPAEGERTHRVKPVAGAAPVAPPYHTKTMRSRVFRLLMVFIRCFSVTDHTFSYGIGRKSLHARSDMT